MSSRTRTMRRKVQRQADKLTRPRTVHVATRNLRTLNSELQTALVLSALDWSIHGATEDQRAGIAVYAEAVTESVLATHAPVNADLIVIIQQRITAAATLDAMAEAEDGDDSGAELSRTLTTIHGELSRKAGVR